MDKIINIAMICDSNYVIPTITAIQSIKDCHENYNVKILINIICINLSNFDKENFIIYNNENIKIKIISYDLTEFR